MDDPTPTATPQNQPNSASRPNRCRAVHEGGCAVHGDAVRQDESAAANGLETVDEFLVSYDQARGRSLVIHGRITWVDGDQGNALLKNQGRALRRVLTILAARKASVPADSRNDQAGEAEQ